VSGTLAVGVGAVLDGDDVDALVHVVDPGLHG
jgi:hypothetical protein